MPESDDIALLRQYASGDEAAFTALFERHVHLVYSAALRQTRNPSHAEEVTQTVFILLARKAGSLGPKTVLSGWLYQAARLTAASLIKREIRRQRREQEVYMQTLTEPDISLWEQISPLLDDAMGRLGEQDRNAVVLRYFENRTPPEVAAALKLNETTTRKRVSRALEKLRAFFAKRGVVLTTTIIAGTISGNSLHAAPAALASPATAIAIAKGATVSASSLALAKAVLKTMAWTKTKIIVACVATALLIGRAGALVTVEAPHAAQRASGPDITGDWEGVMPLFGMGTSEGQTTETRVIYHLSKAGGRYVATFDELDTGRSNVPVTGVDYNFPDIQLVVNPRRNIIYRGKVNADATGMDLTLLSLKRTRTPTPPYARLGEGDFAPRAGSVLQGYWKGGIVVPPGHYPSGLGDRQLGDWDGKPMDTSNTLPLNLKIAEASDGTLRAELDSPLQGADGQPVTVLYDHGTINLVVNSKAGVFQGTLNNARGEMNGSWNQGNKSLPAFFNRADYQAEVAQRDAEDFTFTSASDLQGHWKGAWSAAVGTNTITIPFALDIGKLPDGSYRAALANLEQPGNESPIPASTFEYSSPNLRAEWKWEGGAYNAKLVNGKIVGTWLQGPGEWSLVFERKN